VIGPSFTYINSSAQFDFLTIFFKQVQMDFVLAESTERCAKAIVDSACRGDRYLVEPSWARITFLMKVLCPEVLEWWFHRILVAKSSKKSN
jgi:hypothetical protein